MYTLVIADSRGRGMQSMLQEYNNIGRIRVDSHPGAGYQQAVSDSLKSINNTEPDLIVVMAGICNITYRSPRTKVTTVRFHTEAEIVEHALAAANEAQRAIKERTGARVSFATITGIDLTDYNNRSRSRMNEHEYNQYCAETKVADPYQDMLNAAVMAINRGLVEINIKEGTQTTWTAGAVHSYFKNTHHHYYRRLRDGCHPHPATARDWAKRIVKTIRRTSPKLSTNQ